LIFIIKSIIIKVLGHALNALKECKCTTLWKRKLI